MKDHPSASNIKALVISPRNVCILITVLLLISISISYIPWYVTGNINNTVSIIKHSPDDNIPKTGKEFHLCTNNIKTSYPQNVLAPVHDGCPLKESSLISNLKQKIPSSFLLQKQKDCHGSNPFNLNIICPNNSILTSEVINNGNMNEHRYLYRSESGHCSQTTGMWDKASLSEQKCYFLSGLKYMNLSQNPSEIILDWGAGCGHQLFWLFQYYNKYGFGLDLILRNQIYSLNNFNLNNNGPILGFCSGDATDLSYINDDTFHYIISIGAVLHLNDNMQCDLVINHFLRILKINGKIWIGWNGNEGSMTVNVWNNCLDNKYNNKYGKIVYNIVYEMETLGYTVYEHTTTYSIFITKIL